MASGSKAVVAALIANAGIAVAKFIGFGLTGASSMLAEAIHSVADSGNQALLLLGVSRGRQSPSTAHPFGYGRERYFWAFVVALVIFALGSVFAIYEGVHKFLHPEPITSPMIAVGILLFGLALESWSFKTAVAEAKPLKKGKSWLTFIRHTKQAELPVVLLEDLGALIGLAVALLGVSLAMATGDSRFDALGSITIGILLGLIAIVLAIEMKSLLIGESAGPDSEKTIIEVLQSTQGVTRLIHMKTLHLGPDELFVAAKIELSGEQDLRAVAETINRAEQNIRRAVPSARVIYLEPDVYRSEEPPAEDPK